MIEKSEISKGIDFKKTLRFDIILLGVYNIFSVCFNRQKIGL